jgi:hypothetical protein
LAGALGSLLDILAAAVTQAAEQWSVCFVFTGGGRARSSFVAMSVQQGGFVQGVAKVWLAGPCSGCERCIRRLVPSQSQAYA